MIKADLTPLSLIAGERTDLIIRLLNTGPGTCSNLVFKLVMPTEIPVVMGSERIEIPRLSAGEEAVSVVRVHPKAPGRFTASSTNFSYRDRRGFSRRVEDFATQFVVSRQAPVVVPPNPRLQVRLVSDELPYRKWARLCVRVENIGEVPLPDVHVNIFGPFQVHDPGRDSTVDSVPPGLHADVELSVRTRDAGDIPVRVTTSFGTGPGRRFDEQTFTITVRPEPVDQPGTDRTRILYLAANPIDTERIRWEQDVKEIGEELLRSKDTARFDLRYQFAVRDRDISRALIEFEPEVVHFSGHGLVDGRILAESETGRARPITSEGLTSLFGLLAEHVRCVILSACHSWRLAESMAERIDYVIGMSEDIGDHSAIRFSIGFYQALAAGRPVEHAFEFGCTHIEMDSRRGSREVPRLFRKTQ